MGRWISDFKKYACLNPPGICRIGGCLESIRRGFSWSNAHFWLVNALVSAMLLTGLELLHCTFFFSAVLSDTPSFLLFLGMTWALFLAAQSAMAAVLFLVDYFIGRVAQRVAPADVLLVIAVVASSSGLIIWLRRFLYEDSNIQFVEIQSTLFSIGLVIIVGGICAIGVWLLRPLLQLALQRMPNLGRGTVVLGAMMVLVGVGAVVTSEYVFYSVYEYPYVRLFGLAGSLALLLGVGFVRLRDRSESEPPFRGWLPLIVGVVSIVIALIGLPNPHVRFAVFNHLPVGSELVRFMNARLDTDGDHVAATWLGGADCRPFDKGVAPTIRERLSDGIDQDCSGADSAGTVFGKHSRLQDECRAPASNLSVVFITVESLREDTISPVLTPNIYSFLSGAVRYTRAYCSAPYTFYSLRSLFTGQYYSRISNAEPISSNRICTRQSFVQVLRQGGYRTGYLTEVMRPADINSAFIDENPRRQESESAGLRATHIHASPSSGQLTDRAVRYIEDHGKSPFFLWLHYFDSHAPYKFMRTSFPDGTRPSPYQNSLIYEDHHIGRLFRELGRSGRLNSTVIVLTGDHGEDLGETGQEGHGGNLFERSINVPLILWLPGCAQREISVPASHTQVASTLMEYLGHAYPGESLPSSSENAPPVVSEAIFRSSAGGRLKRAIMDGEWKLMVDVQNGGRMLFNVIQDPSETKNLYFREPAQAMALESKYQHWLDLRTGQMSPGCRRGSDMELVDGSFF